jgi:ATP-binding cassette subfamily C (CFTR/MRP) protein 1
MGALGRNFDTDKYSQTVQVCQLSRDIEILPNGDSTEIGEKGINLR